MADQSRPERHHGRAMLLSGLVLLAAVFTIMMLKGQAERGAPPPSPVQKTIGQGWTAFATDRDGRHFYRPESVAQTSPGIVMVWTQVIFSDEGRKAYAAKRQQHAFTTSGYDKLSHRNVLYEINCFSKRKEIRIEEVQELTADGKALDYAKAGSYKDWSELPEGSAVDILSQAVCPGKQ